MAEGRDFREITMSWNNLPYDIWELIFHRLHDQQHLRSLSLVSKHFLNFTNMARTALTFLSKESTPRRYNAIHRTLFQRFPNLKSVHINNAGGVIDDLVRQLAASAHPLESVYLDLKNDPLPLKPMRLLGRNKQATLRSLTIVGYDYLSQKDVLVIADCFSYLRHLEFPYSSGTREPDDGIRILSSKLASLVSFSLQAYMFSTQSLLYLSSNCPFITEFKGKFTGDHNVHLECFSSFQSLKSLELKNVCISSTGLNHLSQSYLKLEKLLLGSNLFGQIDGQVMCRFLKSCQYLRHLVLRSQSFSPNMANFGASIFKSIRTISIKDCRNVPDNTLFELIRNCPDLEELELCNVYVRLPQELNMHMHYRLQKLLLQSPSLSDEILMGICLVCPNLDSCCHWGCCEVTTQGLEAIVRANCCNIDRFKETGQLAPVFTLYNSVLGPPKFLNGVKEEHKDFFFVREI